MTAYHHVDPKTAERVAKNDATFREANEQIARAADELSFDGDGLPFICECAAEECSTIVPLTRGEYEAIRSNPRWFLNAPGHHVNAQGAATVVQENDRYSVAEKVGIAGEIVEELDPRG